MTDYIALDIIRDLTRARVTRFSLSSFFGRDGLLLVTAFGITACGGGGGSSTFGRTYPIEVIGVEPPIYRDATHDERLGASDSDIDFTDSPVSVDPTGYYIYGDGRANMITGSDAVDTIAGRGGNDEVDGKAGNDRIWGEGGNDRLHGDGGHDRIWGGDGADTIRGGAGNDHLWGGAGADSIRGEAGSDVILLIGSDGATRGGTHHLGYASAISGGINFGEIFGIRPSHLNTDSTYRSIVGDVVDGGEGSNDRLVVFGKADLTGRTGVGASVDNFETITISGEVTIDEFDLVNGGKFSDVKFVGEESARLDIRDENGDGVIDLGTSVYSGNLDVRAVDTSGTEISADYEFSDDTLFSLVHNDRATVESITFGTDSAQASLTLQEPSVSYAAFAVNLESTSLTGSDMWDLATSGNAMYDATSSRVWISPETIDLLRGGYDADTRKFTIVQANDNLELRFGNGTMTLQGDFADADDNDDSVVDFNEFLGAIAKANAGSYSPFTVDLESTSLTGSNMWSLATSGNAVHDATFSRVWISATTIDLLRGGYDATTRKFTIVQANDNLELRFGNGTITLQGDFADADDNDDSVVDFNEFLGAIAKANGGFSAEGNAGFSADYSRLLALELVIDSSNSHVKHEDILLNADDYPPIDFDPDIASITQRIYQADGYGEDRVGTRHDDRLFGYLGSNRLDGLAGNDQIIGGHGDDLIDGGVGEDTAIYFTDIEISGSTVTSATEGVDSLTSIELIRLQGVHTVDVEGSIDAILDFSHDSAQVLDFDTEDRGTFTIRDIGAEDRIDLRDAGFEDGTITISNGVITATRADSGTAATLTIMADGVTEANILRPGAIYGDYRIDFSTSDSGRWNLVDDMGMELTNGANIPYALSPRYDIIFVDTSNQNVGTINTLQSLREGFDNDRFDITINDDNNLVLGFGNGDITLDRDEDFAADSDVSFDEFLSAIGANNIEFG